MIRLNESFTSNSYNNVPPVIMELMKDMKGFSDIVIRLVCYFPFFHSFYHYKYDCYQ